LEKVKTLVIGAGAVGLAIGRELAKHDPDLVVVEKENSFGKHTSSRNSEVIHAGHYYVPGSLKARLCVRGNEVLYRYLEDNGIQHNRTGKIIVAQSAAEEATLHKYHDLGKVNGCSDFRFLSEAEVQELEPRANCKSGLLIPSTGIFDTHSFMQSLATETEKQGAFIVYGMEVVSIRRKDSSYIVEFTNGEAINCEIVINSSGLWADQIAALAGLDTLALNIRQYWCKGEYYKSSKITGIRHLLYPVADPLGVFLGIHLTLNLNGEVRFGPNAFYVDEIDYRFDESFFEEFHTSINRYIDISREELTPDDTGIRPKLQAPGEGFRDFYIQEESQNGLSNFVNLIGIESPGLTASLAIAEYVRELIHKK